MLSVLFICSRNSKLLKSYQIAYLVISILIWIFICLFYLGKLILLIYANFKEKIQITYKKSLKTLFNWLWIICNGGTYIIMFIGLIYDIKVLLIDGKIWSVIYLIIYFAICFIFIICSIIDFCYIENIIKLICEQPKKAPRNIGSSTNRLLNQETEEKNKKINKSKKE